MRRVGIDLSLRAAHRAVVYEDERRIGKAFAVPHTKEGLDNMVARAEGTEGGACEFERGVRIQDKSFFVQSAAGRQPNVYEVLARVFNPRTE